MPDILPTGTTESPVTVVVQEMPEGAASLTDAELRASPVEVTGTVAVSNLPATQPISGTVAVSNLPGTQPISGSVSVSNFPASQAVTGTFWQATQPVSGPLTDAQLRASAIPVTSGAPALTVRASGNVAAPTASSVVCDTGQLAAGSYSVHWNVAAMDTLAVGKGMIVEHRNAANNATVHSLGGCVAGESQSGVCLRVVVALNERIRVIAGTAAGAASSRYVAHLSLYPA